LIGCEQKTSVGERWSEEKAWQWYEQNGWLVGANYNPYNAINQLEMWQAETFDPERIDLELGWAADIGFNSMRVYLHDIAWEIDPEGFLDRVDTYLGIAHSHDISTMLVLFDAVWNPVAKPGKQPDPIPHTHNSGWIQSPSAQRLQDTTQYPLLEEYVKAVITRFANDSRVVAWDLYNEPDNTNNERFTNTEAPNKTDHTYNLMVKTFQWAREVNPSQPLTVGVWRDDWAEDKVHENRFNVFQLENSDIITFHDYGNLENFIRKVESLKRFNRPIMCTEYMARENQSTFQEKLPYMKQESVGAYNWGLVAGKTQTIYPWRSWRENFTDEPDLWFHDVFRPDGTPYSQEEVELISQLTRN
jgi:hypothetical protein